MTTQPKAASAATPVGRPAGVKKKLLWGLAGLSVLLLVPLFVWPTRYKSEPSLYFFQGDRQIRSDRFTGALQMKFEEGWTEIRVRRVDKKTAIVAFGGSEFTIELGEEATRWMDEVHVP